MQTIEERIGQAYEQRATINSKNADPELVNIINEALAGLDAGKYRIAEKINDKWHVHQWLKKALLMYFKIRDNEIMHAQYTHFYDKIPQKFSQYTNDDFKASGIRVVPPSCVRYGSYIGRDTVLMPSCINIGAYVDTGCMIDTWATVGSCAQVGKNVHISGGVGLGGVLEPFQAQPTIIEDNCFIGARSEIVEGVIVEANSVISMGVFLGQSTRIYNRMTEEISYGRIPAGSVVVPGSLPGDDGKHNLYCAVIVKQVDAKTRSKVSLNDLLRQVNE